MSSVATGQGSLSAPSEGITSGYNGNSLAIKALIAVFGALCLYNGLELIALVFLTFTRYKGVYFWSLLVSSVGMIPYTIGFWLKLYEININGTAWLSLVLSTIGWYAMITGQSCVLWSRLHLIVSGESGRKILMWTKWMIITDAIILHIPTTVLTFGCNGSLGTEGFIRAFNIYEKVQMTGFFIQEVILSSIYIHETIQILRTSLQPNTRKLMYQLFTINIIIICMDITLLGIEFASFYIIESEFKGVVYTIKLKMEFAVLGKLVRFVRGSQSSSTRQRSVGFEGEDLEDEASDFVDRERRTVDSIPRPNPPAQRNHQDDAGFLKREAELAEHVEGSGNATAKRSRSAEDQLHDHYEQAGYLSV